MSKGAGVKVWFDDVCTVKKTGFTAMMKTLKPKAILILPWKICWLNNDFTDHIAKVRAAFAEDDRVIYINDQLTSSVLKKEVTLEYPDPTNATGNKPIKETFVFESEQIAATFVQTINEEMTRKYMESANFTGRFCQDLNDTIKQRIASGDRALKEVYLSFYDKVSSAPAVEALFTNYRSMTMSNSAAKPILPVIITLGTFSRIL